MTLLAEDRLASLPALIEAYGNAVTELNPSNCDLARGGVRRVAADIGVTPGAPTCTNLGVA